MRSRTRGSRGRAWSKGPARALQVREDFGVDEAVGSGRLKIFLCRGFVVPGLPRHGNADAVRVENVGEVRMTIEELRF